ncbi:hypothetical protein [Priestia koreensis]|uniref:hypothetical protein n=1 Tax=Priestia koreensis TaxID=284581 RepID=UPI00345B076F
MKPNHKNRTRSYYRYHRRRVIQRKTRLAEHTGWHVPSVGYFAKGKVHCSCCLCAVKTNVDGYPHSEVKRLESCDDQMRTYFK